MLGVDLIHNITSVTYYYIQDFVVDSSFCVYRIIAYRPLLQHSLNSSQVPVATRRKAEEKRKDTPENVTVVRLRFFVCIDEYTRQGSRDNGLSSDSASLFLIITLTCPSWAVGSIVETVVCAEV